jgi:hypothetical protein
LRQVGLLESLSGLIRDAVFRELRDRRRVFLETVLALERALQRSRERVADLETIARQGDRGHHQLFPWFAAQCFPR